MKHKHKWSYIGEATEPWAAVLKRKIEWCRVCGKLRLSWGGFSYYRAPKKPTAGEKRA